MKESPGGETTDPVLVLGSTGQVGRALIALLGQGGIGLSRAEANLAEPESLVPLLDKIRPSAIFNAAAYTAVDLAEKEEALALRVNGEAPGVIARWCAKNGIPLVHYSTDYVFSGEGTQPWKEEDRVAPQNAYGRSKLEGEKQIIESGADALIFRTSWVYDSEGKNFFNTMLRLGRERDHLGVVADQWGAPTYAPHLAQASVEALRASFDLSEFPSGIYHLCHTGETNWHGFALSIFELARKGGLELKVSAVEAIPTSTYPTPAKRPLNSRLNLEKIKKVFSIELPDWKTGLEECMLHQNVNSRTQ